MIGKSRRKADASAAESRGNGKRERILLAAWETIRKYGFDKTTVSDIAKGAGIAKGTVYLYFRSKDEIMLALVELTNRRINDRLERIAESQIPPRAKVREILMFRILRIYDIVKYPHGEEIVSAMKSSISKIIGAFLDEQAALVKKCLDEGVKSGEFTKINTGQVAGTLVAMFELLTPPYYRIRSKSELEKFAGTLLDLVLSGIERKKS
ncbi:MAG: TetR/AcrR family transcriptional regulator [bacterium]|nr:TetR/AcrR family transcriptional regulator [bacterium]